METNERACATDTGLPERTGAARRIATLTAENEALRTEVERLRAAPPKVRTVYRVVSSAAEAFDRELERFHARHNPDPDNLSVSIPIIDPEFWHPAR